jgi:GT2 family glycosyltransferase
MSTPPRVTIITATYNYSAVLRYAIRSALAQTFGDFEYWIVGDGCTDDSAAVVAEFHDARLHWHNLPTNSGSQSFPNNKGLELARGEYIAYLGHDDIWYPTHLEMLVRVLDAQHAAWAHPLAVMLGPAGSGVHELIGTVPPNGDVSAATYITSGVMHTRALVEKIGPGRGYRTLDIVPDREFHERALHAGAPLAHVEHLSVFKFPSAWRKNSYRDKPFHEQAAYLERMQTERDFLERELHAIAGARELKTFERWKAASDIPQEIAPTAPRGAQVEAWRRYRGLSPNALTPRSRLEIVRIRAWRALADVTRPIRTLLKNLLRPKST